MAGEISFTTVVAVDREHLAELEVSWPTWAALRPEVAQAPLHLLVDDSVYPDLDRFASRASMVHPQVKITNVACLGPAAAWKTQREKMLTALVLLAPAVVSTPWLLKLDTDTVATLPSGRRTIAVRRRRGRNPVFISQRWSYTKPADAVRVLDDWADGVPDLRVRPRLDIPYSLLSPSVRHRRIISWWFLGRVDWLLTAASYCRAAERLPVPSHDTYLWYVAQRSGACWRRENMRPAGWDHRSSMAGLRRAAQEALSRVAGGSVPDITGDLPANRLS